MMKRLPHISIWPAGAYTPIWGVWIDRASCRRGDAPMALSYFFDTIRLFEMFL